MSIGMRLTAAGKKVLARGLLGEEILFTKVVIGDGAFDYETESVYDLTAVKSPKMELPITAKEVRGDGTCYIEAHLSNAELTDGFACREHALIARDQLTGEDIVYAYRNCGEEYDFIPSNAGSAHKNLYLEYVVEIQDAENITAVLDLSVAYIDRQQFEEHINSAHPHPNTPQHFSDVISTEKIWATDNDNHLHQISINNFKELLKTETATEEDFSISEKELGLDANIFVFEDFQNDSVTDNFKLKVTSSAENGTLLGLENIEGLKLGYYTISDNYNAETVKIVSVRFNISGYHAKLAAPLSNSYNWKNSYLYRTTTAGADKKTLTWEGCEFGGVEANIPRIIDLPTSAEILADGIISSDGYFTLA